MPAISEDHPISTPDEGALPLTEQPHVDRIRGPLGAPVLPAPAPVPSRLPAPVAVAVERADCVGPNDRAGDCEQPAGVAPVEQPRPQQRERVALTRLNPVFSSVRLHRPRPRRTFAS